MSTGKSFAMLPFFVRDYLAATRHMSLAERGAYTDLLWFQWESGPLPSNKTRLARMLGCTHEEFTLLWPGISEKFELVDGYLVNCRLEQHREKAIALSEKRAMAGHAGGKQSGKQRASKREASASDLIGGLPLAKSNPPSPSPSPIPSPESGVSFGDSRPQGRTAKAKEYQKLEFHSQVVATYHEKLSELPKVKAWSKQRAGALNARIAERLRDGKPADTLAYWQRLFAEVAQSDFLMGRSTDFRADLEWMLRPENFLKIIEGRYKSRDTLNGARHGG